MNEQVTLITVPDVDDVRKTGSDWTNIASGLMVRNHDELQIAQDYLRDIKAARAKIDDRLGPIVRQAHQTHASLVNLRKNLDEPFANAERAIKVRAASFIEDERKRAAAARAAVLEAAKKEAEDRQIALAEELEVTGRLAMADAVISTPVIPEVIKTPEVKAPAGMGARERWSARVDSLLMLIQWVAAHPEFENLLEPNLTALNDLARTQRDAMKVAGVTPIKELTISVR